MKTMKTALLVATLSALAAGSVCAQESGTLKKIKDTGVIALGHRESSIPFSYYDDKQQVVGYSRDFQMKIVDAVKKKLNLPKLQVRNIPVTSQNRIPLCRTVPWTSSAARRRTIRSVSSRRPSRTRFSSSARAS